MKHNQVRILLVASLLPFSTLWLLAANDPAPSDQQGELTPAQVAQAASVKRQQLIFSANQAVTDGQRLLTSAKYDEAADRFQYALDALSNGGESAGLYHTAENGLARAKVGQANDLAKDAKFAQAATRIKEAINLQPDDPTFTAALADLKKQQEVYEAQVRDPEGTTNNPAVTPDFKDRVAAAQKLLFQGDAYLQTGQYEKAQETYSKILILDPYNTAARNKMDVVEHFRDKAENLRHEQYEQEGYTDLDLKWSEAISPDIVVPPNVHKEESKSSNRAAITRKLQTIIVDKINFDKLDIGTVIEFLTQKSKELDPDHEGINFVLRLNSETPPPADPNAAPAPGATPAAPGATPDTNAPKEIHRQVSITLENVPLAEVLHYIVDQTNLQYTVEDYAIYLRPSIDEGENLTVRTFLAPPNFFSGSTLRVSAPSADNLSSTVQSVSTDVQQELISRGIRFPDGASATFLPGSGKLVVRNTPEQLDIIANLIDQNSEETPQVQLESKLLEFNQDAIKGVAFQYLLSALPGGVFGVKTALRDSGYVTTDDDPVGGLSPNSIDALIQQNPASTEGALTIPTVNGNSVEVAPNIPSTLSIGATIDGRGLSAVMEAINNIAGVSLLSAPSVTTISGRQATINIVREFIYPNSFDKPKLSSSPVAYPSAPATLLNLAIPPTPRDFVEQDIGVSLEVKPTTYPDQRIDLDITKCDVVDFDGFIDYGQDIVELFQSGGTPISLTKGVINMPVFNLRSVVTRLQVLDGETAVLGGLIREDTQEINDKVPVLGDLPLLGRLFQSKVTERTKKNLMIFITANLVRSNGKAQYVKTLDAEPEEETLPEPEPISADLTLPSLPEPAPAPAIEGVPKS